MLRDNGSSVGQVDYVVQGVHCTPYGFSAPSAEYTVAHTPTDTNIIKEL